MAKIAELIVDPVRDIGLFWGEGPPPSDFLPGISSGWVNDLNGDVYSLNGSQVWFQLGAAGGGAADWNTMINKPTTVGGFGITDAFTETAADARYWTQAQADGRFLKLAGGTLTGDLITTRLTFHDNLIYESYTNGNANLAFNYFGYAGGTTQFRDTTIYDGKSSSIFYITGSTKAAVFAGALTAASFSTTGLITSAQLIVNGAVAQIIARNPTSSSYATVRLYNDMNVGTRALEIDYSGSAYSGALITGGPTGESGAVYTTGAYPLSFGTGAAERLRIGAAGGVIAYGPANITALQAFGSSTTGQSYGLYVQAGTNSSDNAILVNDQAGTSRFRVRGDGASFFRGLLGFEVDNTYDIGASAASRPAHVYIGTGATIGGYQVATVEYGTGSAPSGTRPAGSLYFQY